MDGIYRFPSFASQSAAVDESRAIAPAAEGLSRFGRRGRRLNQCDDLVNIGERHGLPFQDMAPLPRFAKEVDGPASDDPVEVWTAPGKDPRGERGSGPWDILGENQQSASSSAGCLSVRRRRLPVG